VGNSMEIETAKEIFNLVINGDQALFIDNERTFKHSNYTNHYKFYAVAPIKSPDGFSLGFITAFGSAATRTDESQLDMLNTLSEMITEKLESRIAMRKTMRAQDDRLHVLIHDLKNPMTTISLQSELVSRMANIDEKAATIAGKINNQSKRMVDNLNDILSSARKENGTFKPQKIKLDLRDTLNQALQNLELTLKRKNQTVIINIEEPLELFGDPDKLINVFYHVLQNAGKFSNIHSKIEVTHQIQDNLIQILIKDNGVGLTADDIERLFIKFARLSAVPTQSESSNGLGLIMVKMFLDMHKGKIWAESQGKDQGTTFIIELPIK